MAAKNTIRNEENRNVEWPNLSAKLRLGALMSRTRQQAARNSPRWPPPILEFRATLDENFIGLESSLEAEILVSNLPLYNLFVGEKKKKNMFKKVLIWVIAPSTEYKRVKSKLI